MAEVFGKQVLIAAYYLTPPWIKATQVRVQFDLLGI